MPFTSRNNGAWILAIATLLLAGCASEAPALPPDTTSINRGRDLTLDDFTAEAQAMTCDQIADERRQIANAMQAANNVVNGNRTRNEILVGVADVGLLNAPILLFTNSNNAEKDQIAKLYQRQDTLIKLAVLKHCPAPTS